MRYLLCSSIVFATIVASVVIPRSAVHSEEMYNLEIIFRKTYDDWGDSVHYFGEDVRGVGDINGDGYEDIAATGWEYFHHLGWRSLVFVFLGAPTIDTLPDVILRDNYWGGSPWSRVVGGDVNSDGFSDIVVGLPYGPGKVVIYFGGNPMDTIADVALFEPPPESFFGCDVATGDINGDGHCDVVAADYDKDNKGAVYVCYGGPLLDNILDITLNGHGQEGFGSTVGSGGDVNSDGYDDVVVGALANSETYLWAGKIYVYYGGSPMDTLFDVSMSGEGPQQHLGWSKVDICADRSTYDFVLAGTQFWPNGFGADNPGKVYVLFGGDPMDGVPDVCMHGQALNSGLGTHVRNAGDIDGDGYDDLIAGAPTEDPWGTAYVWLCGGDIDTIPDGSITGDSTHTLVGFVVASAGDVDGDGRDEVMVSNYPAGSSWHTVWVCRYTGTGVQERQFASPMSHSELSITCSPNPFRLSTSIRYSLPTECNVNLSLYDISGRLVETLVNETQKPGIHQVRWNRESDPNGVYFYRLKADESVETRKMVVVD